MTIFEGLEGLQRLSPGAAVSIGNFDGIHRGHRRILDEARRLRDAPPGPGAERAMAVAVVTFEPHPLTVLRPEKAPPRLTPPRLKRALLESAGVDDLVILPPTPELLDLTAEQF